MDTKVLFIFTALLQTYSILAQTVSVTTPHGDITGEVLRNNNVQFNVFLGIPYAKAPTGSRRFQPPEALENWETPLQALDHKPFCPQTPTDDSAFRQIQSEDCLYLSVYVTGDLNDPPRLPVMVFIHGGGDREGGAAEHSGIALVTSGEAVVVVVIQYRLGFLGFATSGDDRVPGNNGFKDQVFALRWVQDNIESFNGDKNRVTLFGESAGGSSVLLHMLSPMSEGLFHRAIAESARAVWRVPELESYQGAMEQVAIGLGCPEDDTESCLQTIPFENIVNSEYNSPSQVIDGEFVTDQPETLFEEGRFQDVELIIGFNTDEGFPSPANIFLLSADDRGALTDPELYRTGLGLCLVAHLPPSEDEDSDEDEEDDDDDGSRESEDEEEEQAGEVGDTENEDENEAGGDELASRNPILASFVTLYGSQLTIPGVSNTDELMDMLIGKYASFGDPILNTRGILNAFRDTFFVSFAIFVANQVERHGGNVRVYVFDHRTSTFEQPGPGDVPLYAPHESELEYVFGYGLLQTGASPLTDEEKQLSRSMIKAWTSFAQNGVPSFLAMDGAVIEWPQYPQFVEFDTSVGSESMQDLSATWQPVANFWSSIESLTVREDDDYDEDSSSEEYETSVLKLDSFEADLAVILLAVAVFLLLLSTCTLAYMLCTRSTKGGNYVA